MMKKILATSVLCGVGLLCACGPTAPSTPEGTLWLYNGEYLAHGPTGKKNPIRMYIKTDGIPESYGKNGVDTNVLTVESLEPIVWKESGKEQSIPAFFDIKHPCSVLPHRVVTFNLTSYDKDNKAIFSKDVPFDMKTICR